MLLNVYSTHRDPPEPPFPYVLRNRRDLRDPELRKHLNGFMGFVMAGGKRKMTQTRYQVLCHIERVRHQVALEVDARHMAAFAAWAREANAIVFLPDGSVRAPDGGVLVAPDTGDAQPGAEVPYPSDAVARKAATDAKLAELGIGVPASLPPVVSEVEVELRTAEEVAARCLGLFACAVRAESLAAQKPILASEIEKRMPRAFAALTPKERAFMDEEAPSQQAIVASTWRYEALDALRWAIGGTSELPYPSGPCTAPAIAKAMLEGDGEKLVASAQLRPTAEILDALDLHYRLDWAVTDARVNTKTTVPGVDPGVVVERHYAFNWLTRFQDAEWDDVDTPT